MPRAGDALGRSAINFGAVSLNWLLMLPYFAGLAAWVFPRLSLRAHSAGEEESLPRAPFAIAALACLMGLSLTVSLFVAAQTLPVIGSEASGPAGVTVDYWWTRYLYQLRFHADVLALAGLAGIYLIGFLLSLHLYGLPTPTLPHRRAAYLLAALGSAAAALLSVDLVALLFFALLFLLALWLFARLEAPRAADRMFVFLSLGGALLTVSVVLLWREAGLTSMAGLPLTLVGSDPRLLRSLGIITLFGFLPLLAAFPCSRWLALLTHEAPRGAMVCALLLLPAAWVLALRLLPGTVVLPLLPGLSTAGIGLGILTLLWGAFGAWGSRSLRSLALWVTIAQSGLFLLALGVAARPLPLRFPLESSLGLQAALLGALTAPAGLVALWSVASTVLARVGTDGYPGLGGLLPRLPLAAVTCLLGGLSLAGVPPLPGFWVQRLLLAGQPWPLLAAVLLADAVVLYAVLGGFARVFLRREDAPPLSPYRRWLEGQLLFVVLALLGLSVALTAGPLRDWAETAVRGAFLPGS